MHMGSTLLEGPVFHWSRRVGSLPTDLGAWCVVAKQELASGLVTSVPPSSLAKPRGRICCWQSLLYSVFISAKTAISSGQFAPALCAHCRALWSRADMFRAPLLSPCALERDDRPLGHTRLTASAGVALQGPRRSTRPAMSSPSEPPEATHALANSRATSRDSSEFGSSGL